jgi:hypothetical protein
MSGGTLLSCMVFSPSFHSKNWADTCLFLFLHLIEITAKLLLSFLKKVPRDFPFSAKSDLIIQSSSYHMINMLLMILNIEEQGCNMIDNN